MNTFLKNSAPAFSSPKVRTAAGIAGALLLAALIFHAGVVVGAHRGRFGAERGFRSSFFPSGFALPHGFISNGYGAVGTVTAVTPPLLTLATREGTVQTVLVGTSTVVRSMGSVDVHISAGDQVVVLGEPDGQGRINAKLIRILPSVAPRP